MAKTNTPKTTTPKTAKTAAPKTATQKPSQLDKLQANKAKADARDAFINKATTGTLKTLKGNMQFEPAKKLADFLDRWILVLGIQYVAIKNPKFGDGLSMKAFVVDRDGLRSEVWVTDTLKSIFEDNINEHGESEVFPAVLKIIRPGRAFVPTTEDAPTEVNAFFEKWIAQNGASFNTKDESEDISF